ncbi:MAG TPA: hypothetical protein VL337_10620 [Acidimicrobiales bacterium]|nr:hypothetical protein [Acidimicrobiales bacterium]
MDLDLAELQGNILRGYGRAYPTVRHLVLRVVDATAARRALGSMTDGDRATPDVTAADRSPREAGYPWCLNVGFTWAGLRALGLPPRSLGSFPPEFRAGMGARARRLGDVGTSAPEHWVAGLGDAGQVHALVTVHGHQRADVVGVSEQVVALEGGAAFAPLPGGPLDGATFTGTDAARRVHFGYRDGISQPRFEGVHDEAEIPGRPFTPLGAVLLGQPSLLPGITWRVPEPEGELGANGTFDAFRVLGQDVAGFEAFLHAQGDRLGCDPEEVAAKVCGRWRNGAPLTLAPTRAEADAFDHADLNRFAYREGDGDGRRCPIGSHIRRTNPRDAHIVQRGTNDVRTLVRRGMPFGPPYDPAVAEDPPVARGLLGNFVCASLSAQFEAMQADWLNLGLLDPRITGTNDPLVGANDGATSTAAWTTAAGDDVVVHGLPRFVHTLGGAYCFLPSLPALRWIAAGRWGRTRR